MPVLLQYLDSVAQAADLAPQVGVAHRGGPHVDPSASRAEVHGEPQHADLAALCRSQLGHGLGA